MIKVVWNGDRPQGDESKVTITEITLTPEEQAEDAARRATYMANLNWAAAHTEINRTCAGKFICVTGGELFSASAPGEAHAQAHAAHPEEIGASYSAYVPTSQGPKIYAN